jgi:hypothetical protein
MMDPAKEEEYLQLAANNPDMLCSEAPPEVLEICSSEIEPTSFLEEFFAAGYSQWVMQTYGRRLPQERINNAIIVLWLRACRLHTSILLGDRDPDWDKPFFSDVGLYGEG